MAEISDIVCGRRIVVSGAERRAKGAESEGERTIREVLRGRGWEMMGLTEVGVGLKDPGGHEEGSL